jgi:glycosyltransferase involved in cell wall biosynthesis
MKVLLAGRFGEGDILTGPERFARELFSELKENKIEVVFIEYFFKGYKGSSLGKRIFGKMNLNNDNSVWRLGILPILLRLISGQYDLIHLVNLQRFFMFVFLIKPFIRSKLTATLHGFLRFEIPSGKLFKNRNFIDFLVEKLIIKKSDLVIFPSGILLEAFRDHFKNKLGRYEIIPNGIGKIFGNSNISYPPVKDSINSIFYNGFSGTIDRGINSVFNLIKESKNKIKLFVMGETDPKLRSTGNLEIIFTSLKNQKELICFLRDKHAMIKGPAFDTFPIGMAECMALGLIPVITDKIGLVDYIHHGVNGFIYDESPNSDNSLQKILDDFYNGKFDLNSISCNAKKIYDKLNWNIISNKYIQAYNTLL